MPTDTPIVICTLRGSLGGGRQGFPEQLLALVLCLCDQQGGDRASPRGCWLSPLLPDGSGASVSGDNRGMSL